MSITQEFLKVALYGANWVMYVLVACSVISIAVIVDRIVYLTKMRGDFAEFVEGLTERLNSSTPLEQTAAWCAGQKMLESNVATVGLERARDPLRSCEEAMNATMIAARTKMDRGLTILATLGNNTPFIGLFGTIIGIIQAFHAMAINKSAGPEVVMASISEALVATAMGILVAIPAVISYNLILRSIKTRMANSETTARIIVTFLGRERPASAEKM